ncbi:MAG TPA: hypothetical protein VJS12_20285 [Steroidobacteraceae bacterium]|nr:hypothetical protein [Steroidobacteraceae bacterium]
MIRIEFEAPTSSECGCCGKTTVRLTRFVYRDEDAYAVYYAQYTPDHSETRLSGLISLGDWGEDSEPAGRVAFPFQIWMDESDFKVGLMDAGNSPWKDVTFLGRILDRNEALTHAWVDEVFHITDHMVTDDAEITGYFGARGGG